jgi:hypothetical protein
VDVVHCLFIIVTYLNCILGLALLCLTPLFNNISVISWRSVLLVEETGGPGENHRPAANHCQTLSHNIVSSTPRHEAMSGARTLMLIGTDYKVQM